MSLFHWHKWARWNEPYRTDTTCYPVQARTCERCGRVQTRAIRHE